MIDLEVSPVKNFFVHFMDFFIKHTLMMVSKIFEMFIFLVDLN